MVWFPFERTFNDHPKLHISLWLSNSTWNTSFVFTYASF